VVLTTKDVARAEWLVQLKKPGVRELHAGSVSTRRDASFAAGLWHFAPDIWVEPLADALRDSDREVCFNAAYALGEFGPEAAPAVNSLVSILNSDDATLREGATFALAKLGMPALDQLIRLIDDKDQPVSLAAAKCFLLMGSLGREAVPRLITAAERHADDEKLSHLLASAIARMDRDRTIDALGKLLTSEATGIRSFAAFAVGEIGPPAQVFAQDLLPLLSDNSTRVRRDAAYALSRIDLPADFSTAELEAATHDSDRNVSLWAAAALRAIRAKR
jgi:HEAT repeat protein